MEKKGETAAFYELVLKVRKGERKPKKLLLRMDKTESPHPKLLPILNSGDERAFADFAFKTLIPAADAILVNWDFGDTKCGGDTKRLFLAHWAGPITRLTARVQQGQPMRESDILSAEATAFNPLTPEEVVYWPRVPPQSADCIPSNPAEPVLKHRKAVRT